MVLVVVHSNLSVFERHEYALDILSLPHFQLGDISDFRRHLLAKVDPAFVVEGV